MALIGVVADTDTQVSLLDLSEVHYVLGQTLSFVTLEFTAQVEEKAQSLTLCLHGKVLTGSEFQNLFGRFKNRELRRLFSYGSVTERPASGVYDFGRTFRYGTSTNRFYEGPNEWRRVAVRSADSIVKYGAKMTLPKFSAKVPPQSSEATASTVELSAHYGATELYAFRVGFFLKRPPSPKKPSLLYRILGLPVGEYAMHTYFCPQDSQNTLRDLGELDKLTGKSRLWLTLAPYQELWDKSHNADGNGIGNWKDEPHSDVWIVVPNHYSLNLVEEDVDGNLETNPRRSNYVLFPPEEPSSRPPYIESHVQFRANVPALRKPDFIGSTDDRGTSIRWQLNDLHRPTILSIVNLLWTCLPVLAIAIAVAIGIAGGELTQGGVLVALGLYGAAVILIFVFRWVFTEFRNDLPYS